MALGKSLFLPSPQFIQLQYKQLNLETSRPFQFWHPISGRVEVDTWAGTQSGPGWGVRGKCEVLTSDLQAGLTLPSAILVNRFASVEASIAALSGQDPKPAQPTLCLLCEAPLVRTHGLAVSQPVGVGKDSGPGPRALP